MSQMSHREAREEMYAGEEDYGCEECVVPAPESEDCEMCGGPVGYLGSLGNRAHFQCRDCGAESSRLVVVS